jgi:hypothetical protein
MDKLELQLQYCDIHGIPYILCREVYPVGGRFEIEISLASYLVKRVYPNAEWRIIETTSEVCRVICRHNKNEDWSKPISFTKEQALALIPNAKPNANGGLQWQTDFANMLSKRDLGKMFRTHFGDAIGSSVYMPGEIADTIENPALTEEQKLELEFGGLDQPAKPSPVKKETKKADHVDKPEPKKAESKPIQTMNGSDPDDPPKNESKQSFKGALFNAVTRYQESHPTEMKTIALTAQVIQESEGLSKEEALFVAIFDGDNHHPTIEELNQLDGLDLTIAAKMINYWEPHTNEAKLEDAINNQPKNVVNTTPKKAYLVNDITPATKTDGSPYAKVSLHELDADRKDFVGEPFDASIFEGFEPIEMGFQIACNIKTKGKYKNCYDVEIVARD